MEKDNIHIQKAILFGSYANGNFNELSDIDLALVSNNFSGDRWDDKALLREYKARISWDLSLLPYTPEDFNNSFFVRDEIIKNGIVII